VARAEAKRRRRRAAEKPQRARKISITVEAQVLRDVEAQARRSRRTLSAHITEALARDVRRRRLCELIDAYEAEHGTITGEELAAIQSEWPA
jgi:macrodomain Ter protein organizer (MatP/YcbG family)